MFSLIRRHVPPDNIHMQFMNWSKAHTCAGAWRATRNRGYLCREVGLTPGGARLRGAAWRCDRLAQPRAWSVL